MKRNYCQPVEGRTCHRQIRAMHNPKSYKCTVCGAEIADLPMPVLQHQLSHVERLGRAVGRAEPDAPTAEDQHERP